MSLVSQHGIQYWLGSALSRPSREVLTNTVKSQCLLQMQDFFQTMASPLIAHRCGINEPYRKTLKMCWNPFHMKDTDPDQPIGECYWKRDLQC